MNEKQELIEMLAETRIDWDATRQGVMSPASGILAAPADLEAYQQRDRDLVGRGYFYIDVRNMGADLALMHSTRPGYWETEIIPRRLSPLLEKDLLRSIEAAGGAVNWSGHYPLDPVCIWKLQESYLGNGQEEV
jgi:hypothetical protein